MTDANPQRKPARSIRRLQNSRRFALEQAAKALEGYQMLTGQTAAQVVRSLIAKDEGHGRRAV